MLVATPKKASGGGMGEVVGGGKAKVAEA